MAEPSAHREHTNVFPGTHRQNVVWGQNPLYIASEDGRSMHRTTFSSDTGDQFNGVWHQNVVSERYPSYIASGNSSSMHQVPSGSSVTDQLHGAYRQNVVSGQNPNYIASSGDRSSVHQTLTSFDSGIADQDYGAWVFVVSGQYPHCVSSQDWSSMHQMPLSSCFADQLHGEYQQNVVSGQNDPNYIASSGDRSSVHQTSTPFDSSIANQNHGAGVCVVSGQYPHCVASQDGRSSMHQMPLSSSIADQSYGVCWNTVENPSYIASEDRSSTSQMHSSSRIADQYVVSGPNQQQFLDQSTRPYAPPNYQQIGFPHNGDVQISSLCAPSEKWLWACFCPPFSFTGNVHINSSGEVHHHQLNLQPVLLTSEVDIQASGLDCHQLYEQPGQQHQFWGEKSTFSRPDTEDHTATSVAPEDPQFSSVASAGNEEQAPDWLIPFSIHASDCSDQTNCNYPMCGKFTRLMKDLYGCINGTSVDCESEADHRFLEQLSYQDDHGHGHGHGHARHQVQERICPIAPTPIEASEEIMSQLPECTEIVHPLSTCFDTEVSQGEAKAALHEEVLSKEELNEDDFIAPKRRANEFDPGLMYSTDHLTNEAGDDMYAQPKRRKTEHPSLLQFCDTEENRVAEPAKVQMEADEHEQERSFTEFMSSSDVGLSLTELFTFEQLEEHILSLRKSIDQSESRTEAMDTNEEGDDRFPCSLCGLQELSFEPRPMCCKGCSRKIGCNATYYVKKNSSISAAGSDSEGPYCDKCRKVSYDKMEKRQNSATGELWAQCSKCGAWQHQICSLFNDRKNGDEKAKYTCPTCLLQEIKSGLRRPPSRSAVLGAEDLPKTKLSDHIERHLTRSLIEEREKRARQSGHNSFDEVQTAEDLVVRVVSSVNKNVKVSKNFGELFKEKDYPSEFPYKSKAILLFQRIEGADVCLLGIYVQEFGSKCANPNQRRICLSYIDSVKHFRPDIQSESGEPLRTFVYQDILLGYLDYSKQRGFTSCYFWICPPSGKYNDYIFYCRPKGQKRTGLIKLCKWYQNLANKATKENIVVSSISLHAEFLKRPGGGECEAEVSAARLPYFGGDLWPRLADDFLETNLPKNGSKPSGHKALTGDGMDILLMNHLETCMEKKTHIMLHFQHTCRCCCMHILCGRRWVCKTCRSFQLCDRCYDKQQKLESRQRHPIKQQRKHSFKVEECIVPDVTYGDEDPDMTKGFCDTREAFLKLCVENEYRFDTLRRAKHSTTMLLHHLHS